MPSLPHFVRLFWCRGCGARILRRLPLFRSLRPFSAGRAEQWLLRRMRRVGVLRRGAAPTAGGGGKSLLAAGQPVCACVPVFCCHLATRVPHRLLLCL